MKNFYIASLLALIFIQTGSVFATAPSKPAGEYTMDTDSFIACSKCKKKK